MNRRLQAEAISQNFTSKIRIRHDTGRSAGIVHHHNGSDSALLHFSGSLLGRRLKTAGQNISRHQLRDPFACQKHVDIKLVFRGIKGTLVLGGLPYGLEISGQC